MKSYLDLIPISARVHKKQSRMTRICIILAVFLVTAIFSMADMEIRSQQLQEIKKGGNWHVMFSGIDEQTAAMIAARPEVRFSGWYAYLGAQKEYTLSGNPATAIGVDKSAFEGIFPIRMTEGVYPSGAKEVALTENARKGLGIKLGDTITLEHPGGKPLELSVVGFTEGTAQLLKEGENGVVFTTEGFRAAFPEQGYTSSYVVQLTPYCFMQKVIADIASQYGLEDQQVLENGNLLGVLGQSDNSYIVGLYGVAAVLFFVVLLAGVLMIAGSLNSNVLQRTEFFGLLCCLGATPKQIKRFVRREGLQWCKTAIPLGLALGTVVVWLLCGVLRILTPGYFSELPVFGVSGIGILSGIVLGVVTVLLAARSPAQKAARVSPLAAVSGNAGLSQPVSGGAHTRLFSIETALGVHHATASKKNFLLMVGSFSLSIILFLAFSATVDFMHHAVRPLKPWTPDLSIGSKDNTCSVPAGLLEKLGEQEGIKRVYGRMFAYDIPARAQERERTVNLISYEEQQFAWAKENLVAGSLEGAAEKDQVLVVYNQEDSWQAGDSLTLSLRGGTREVRVAGVLSTSPFAGVEGADTVICSEATFRELTGERNYTILDIQLSPQATEDDIDEIRSLTGSGFQFSDRRADNREARGAFYSMALFIYGFLAVILLITVFNIVNSVAMSVAARMKQYGAMRAIGMSNRQLVGMVRAEALTYSAVGSIVGCTGGVFLHQFLFGKMVTAHWGDAWQLPLGELGIILTVVLLTTLLAVHGPAKRIHAMSIVDTISAH